MRVLIITYCLGGSASGIITSRMVEELARRGHELHIVTAENHIGNIGNCKIDVIKSSLLNNEFFNLLRIKVLTWLGFSAYNSHFIWRFRVIQHIKALLHNWHPDWIYCRSTPIDACLVGVILHKMYRLPTIQHFSDPLPGPSCTSVRVRRRFIKQTQIIMSESELVSYPTEEMANYIKSLINYDYSKRIHILPDVIDGKQTYYHHDTHKYNNPVVLAYMGSIYGTRNPIPLFQSIELLKTIGINCILRIYSTPPKNVRTPSYVHYMGYTTDVQNALLAADVLVDLDGDDSLPVFVSSKLKDYLIVARPILSISPENSPARKLVRNIPTVQTTINDRDRIASAIQAILLTEYSEGDYQKRFLLAQQFTPKAVIDKLLSIIDTIPIVYE